MNTSKTTTLIEKLVFDNKIHVVLSTGDRLTLPYDYTERIKKADKAQLQNYRLIGGGRGIHFPDIDEDISLNGILRYKTSHDLLAS